MKQNKDSKKRKLLYYIGIPVLIIAAIVIFLLSGVNSFLKPAIKKALTKVVVDGSDSLYRFNLKDYTVGGAGSSIEFTGLSIEIDSSRYQLLKTAGLLPKMIYSIQLEKASVSGLGAWELWRHKNIDCSSIVLHGAKVKLHQQEKSKDTTSQGRQKTLYELIKPDINNINVGEIRIADADVDFYGKKQQTSGNTSYKFDSATIILTEIKVDSNAYANPNRILYATNLNAKLGSFKMASSNGFYKFTTKGTEYDFKERSATVHDFKMLPAVTQAEFNRRMGHEADLATIVLPNIKLEGFNADALINDNNLFANLITLTEPSIKLFKDKTAGTDTRNKLGKYPHQLLMKADMQIRVKQLDLSKGYLEVAQKSAKTLERGEFKFYYVRGSVKNITNYGPDIESDKWCRADLSAGFLGNNLMNAVFNFDLAAATDNGHYITDATLKSLPPADINPIFRALAEAEMESFELDKLDYHVEGYDQYAIGDLTLLYHDLKLNVLKEKDNGELKKKGLISLLANLLKLYKANPMPGDEERKANNIRFDRPSNKNYFGAMVLTLLKCTQEIGIKGKNKSLPGM